MAAEIWATRGDALQGLDRVGNNEEIGVDAVGELTRHPVDDEIAHAVRIEVGDEAVAVITLGGNGEKERVFGRFERTRVGEQMRDVTSHSRGRKTERPGYILD